MMKVLKTTVFSLCLAGFAGFSARAATVPVQNMSPLSIAAEYHGAVHGHEELYKSEAASVATHVLRLHYSPIPYLRLSAGIGSASLYADPSIKDADFGLAATGSIALYLPKLLSFLSLTGGYDGYYMRASEESAGYLEGSAGDGNGAENMMFKATETAGKTVGTLHTPYIGIVFHASRFVDIEAGGLYRHFTVTREQSITRWDDGYGTPGVTLPTPNNFKDRVSEQVRLYGTLTFHERESGASLVGGASYA
jgi:hypothetical protein